MKEIDEKRSCPRLRAFFERRPTMLPLMPVECPPGWDAVVAQALEELAALAGAMGVPIAPSARCGVGDASTDGEGRRGEANKTRYTRCHQANSRLAFSSLSNPNDTKRRQVPPSLRSDGNRITSRMLWLSVSSIIRRSRPMPQPPVGGMPYSSARMKSAS